MSAYLNRCDHQCCDSIGIKNAVLFPVPKLILCSNDLVDVAPGVEDEGFTIDTGLQYNVVALRVYDVVLYPQNARITDDMASMVLWKDVRLAKRHDAIAQHAFAFTRDDSRR